ncbi:hypothetical protein HK405_008647 [Cladochytrium tenue]|nr:hypothetical protein HK405_008647 [Cladochytrium tenue]
MTLLAEVLKPALKELSPGTAVRRLLPAFPRQAVGPFIFLDHMGEPAPAPGAPAGGINVGPHPHIGLSTVTYLYSGALMHHDSLGSAQLIRPGDVNFMTAGRGIVHSERPAPAGTAGTAASKPLHGIQFWCALPQQLEDSIAPAFQHVPAALLPEAAMPGATVRLLIGAGADTFGLFSDASPVQAHQPETLYASVEFTDPRAELCIRPKDAEEVAVYAIDDGGLLVTGPGGREEPIKQFHLAVVKSGSEVKVRQPKSAAAAGVRSRGIVLGGSKLDGHRNMW